MTSHERGILEEVPPSERSFFCWSIVSAGLCDVRNELKTDTGLQDTVAYDRLCGLVGTGTSSISALKTLMTFQIPFIYVHMLALMVHMVNVMTAISAGVSIGLNLRRSVVDYASITNEMIFLLLQGCIYQALLSIGAALSFPVTGASY